MAQLLLSPIGILVQQLSNAGQPLSGGLINTYVAGTTTPIVTYTDSTGSVQNSNPIVLNSAGRLTTSVWVPSNTPHKMILTDVNSNVLSTIDQLYGINDPFFLNQVNSSLPTGGGTANAQTIANTTPITTQSNGIEQWYTPGVVNTGDTTVNVDGLGAMHVRYLTKVLVGGELQPGVPVILKSDGTFWNLAWSAKGPVDGYYGDTGTVNALVITANLAQGVLAQGMHFFVNIANTTTASSPTLNVNGLGAKAIYYNDNATPLAAGALISGSIYTFAYDIGISGFICLNPSRATGSFTLTLTGFSGTVPSGTINYAIEPDGKLASVWAASAITGTSNAGTMTGTGVPAALTTGTSKRISFSMEDNTSTPVGAPFLLTGTSTTWTMTANSIAGGSWTSSGTKGIIAGAQAFFTLD